MKLCSSDSSISRTLRPLGGLFEPPFGHLPTLQTHSSRRPLNNSFSHHPQVAQRKQSDQLSHVFDQAPIPRLAVAELALELEDAIAVLKMGEGPQIRGPKPKGYKPVRTQADVVRMIQERLLHIV